MRIGRIVFKTGNLSAKRNSRDTQDLHLEWNVPYKPGNIKGCCKKEREYSVHGRSSHRRRSGKIILTPDRTKINAGGEDLSYVKVEIADEEGNVCPNADNLIKFSIAGEGVIAGVGNGSPISHENFNASERKAFHGLCLAVVQSKREHGTIDLSAESDGLHGAKVSIDVK